MDIKDVYLVMKDPDGTAQNKEKAKEVINRPIPKDQIKYREGSGGRQLAYIEGETVIRLLNEAFGEGGWSFQIVNKTIVPSVPKQKTAYNKKTGKSEKVFDDEGRPVMEEQPPIVEVHGRLIVPGFGVREQFGTKALLGGYTEQEGAAKAAATDALKKCATLFGIGLELYDDKENEETARTDYSRTSRSSQDYGKRQYSKASELQAEQEESWEGKEADIKKLKELKYVLFESDDNNLLNPYVEKFTGIKGATWEYITPSNIASFNKFLEREAAKI